MPYTIRIATEGDFHAIFLLIKEFAEFQQTPVMVKVTAEQLVEDKAYFNAFVVEDAGKVVGFATYFYAYYSWSGKAVYLDDLYLTPGYRKQGIGKELLQRVVELAREKGCKKVKWQVSAWNKNAIAFYEQMGAVVDGDELNCNLYL